MAIFRGMRQTRRGGASAGRGDNPHNDPFGSLVQTSTTFNNETGSKGVVWNQDKMADPFTQTDSWDKQSMKVSATMHDGKVKAGAIKGENGWHGAVSNANEGTLNTTGATFKTRFGAARQARKGLEQMHTGTRGSQFYGSGGFAPQNDSYDPFK